MSFMKQNFVHEITILPDGRKLFANDGASLLDVLRSVGVFISAACGGNGTCGKCKVRLISGTVGGVSPDFDNCILSCSAIVKGNIEIELINPIISELTDASSVLPTEADIFGVVDIGTTVIAAATVSESDGKILSALTEMNPQGAYGADVLTRISACNDGKLKILQELATSKISDMLTSLGGGRRFKRVVIAANTTMQHILLGVDPSSIGVYPFTPSFTNTQYRNGAELGIPADEICVLASASAYIGSDITAGAVALNIHNDARTVMLVDVGTNGEVLISHKGKIYAASTAAGPALEGASIECGVAGVKGAISSVGYDNGELVISTVDGEYPVGICGSGLIDLIKVLTEEGIIDQTGAFDYDNDSPLSRKLSIDKFYLTDNVYLSAADIRQFQVAKAAISAGIEALLDNLNIGAADVDLVYIAGGLGNHMKIDSAIRVGMLPKEFLQKTVLIGNTALLGAAFASKSNGNIRTIEEVASKVNVVELSFSEFFRIRYIENMYF